MPAPAEMLQQLRDLDPKVRLRAAQWIARQTQTQPSRAHQAWMGNRGTTGPLIEALDDPEPAVVEKAIFALTIIARHYFKDVRAYPAVVRLLQSKRQSTRSWALEAASVLRGKRCLEDVFPLCSDASPKVRAAAIAVFRDLALGRPWTGDNRDRLLGMALAALDDEDREVRGRATTLLREIGDRTVPKRLKRALAKEPEAMNKQFMQMVLDEIKNKVT
jgi:HEAT repeat protein